MGRRPRARSSRAGRGARRVPARGPARLGVAAHDASHVHLCLAFLVVVLKPCRQTPVWGVWQGPLSVLFIFSEQVQRSLPKQSLQTQRETSGHKGTVFQPFAPPLPSSAF